MSAAAICSLCIGGRIHGGIIEADSADNCCWRIRFDCAEEVLWHPDHPRSLSKHMLKSDQRELWHFRQRSRPRHSIASDNSFHGNPRHQHGISDRLARKAASEPREGHSAGEVRNSYQTQLGIMCSWYPSILKVFCRILLQHFLTQPSN